MKTAYTLIDVVDRLIGGDIIPVGDSAYDEKALERQKLVEDLIDYLLDGVLRCYEGLDSYMYSVRVAADEARTYLMDKSDTLNAWLENERKSSDEVSE